MTPDSDNLEFFGKWAAQSLTNLLELNDSTAIIKPSAMEVVRRQRRFRPVGLKPPAEFRLCTVGLNPL
jgi:hypothetical protein